MRENAKKNTNCSQSNQLRFSQLGFATSTSGADESRYNFNANKKKHSKDNSNPIKSPVERSDAVESRRVLTTADEAENVTTKVTAKSETANFEGKESLIKRGYEIGEYLGGGSFSKVYSATKVSKGVQVAIKVITIRRGRPESLKFLEREMKAVQVLDHEHIVKTIAAFKNANLAFVVMEHLVKGTISDYMQRKGPVAEEQAMVWTREITEALEYMHRRDWAHRDIKIENIGLSASNRVKLMDFGFAVETTDPVTKEQMMAVTKCGSVPYVAPENLHGLFYDPSSADVWSLGVTVYVMLMRRFPFVCKKNDLSSMKRKQMSSDWMVKRVYNCLSNEAFEFLVRLLTYKPGERVTCTQALGLAWLQGE